MGKITEQMTNIYVFVDDYLKAHPELAEWRSSNNREPDFSDAEVITIGLMQSCLAVATLKKAYQHIEENYHSAFPRLCSYKQWIARLHKLSDIIGHMVEAARLADGLNYSVYLLDSKPVALCKTVRHGTVRLLREDGAYFAKSSKGWFFGFKLHTLFNIEGRILGAVLSPANLHDREPALPLALHTDGGIAFGDQAFGGQQTVDDLANEADLLLITRKHAPQHYKALVATIRQRVETFLSHFYRLLIDFIAPRSWSGLWAAIKLKLLAYNLHNQSIVCLD